jgi:hypothetical protein
MSCGATAATVSGRLSGARRLITLDEVGNLFGKGDPRAANFPGVGWNEVSSVLPQVGASTQHIGRAGMTVAGIEMAAQQGRGLVIFGVQWSSGGKHLLTAFRNTAGQVVVADQFGVRFLSDIGRVGNANAAFSLTGDAMLVENVGFVQRVESLRLAGLTAQQFGSSAGKFGTALTQSGQARRFLTASLGLETVILPWVTTWKIDAGIRNALGYPQRDPPAPGAGSGGGSGGGGGGGAAPAPPGSQPGPPIPGQPQPLPPDAASLLSALPPKGPRSRQDLQQATSITGARFYEAVQILETRGLVKVNRFGQDPLNILSLERP